MNRCIDVHILFNIGTVCDHNSHRYAQGKEDLAHGIQEDLHQPPECNTFQIGCQIYRKTLQTGPGNALSIRTFQSKCKNGDRHDHDQHDRHQDTGAFLNTLLDAVKNDKSRDQHKDDREHHRLQRIRDKSGEIAVGCGSTAVPDQIYNDISGNPSSDHRVVGHNNGRHQEGDNAKKFPLGIHRGIGIDRILPGPSSHCNVGCQERKTECKRQDQVNDNKQSAAVLRCQIRKSPEISYTDRAACSSHDKADLPGKSGFFLSVFIVRIFLFSSFCVQWCFPFCH